MASNDSQRLIIDERPKANRVLKAVASYAIEAILVAAAGCVIMRLSSDCFNAPLCRQKVSGGREKNTLERSSALDSMVEIYDNVNLISFVDSTEMSLRDSSQEKHFIDMEHQTHTLMNQRLKDRVMPDQLDSFLEFTNITTVQERLRRKKIISADFVDVISGWFRAQYITVKSGPDGRPDVVIYTTRNVDDEKRREEHLVRLSMTDELTRLYNRRSFVEDLAEHRKGRLGSDFVMFSIDVNGLKVVNDTKGHTAGDELIRGAADCLAMSIGQIGKVYRTGGDEFMAIVHTDSPELVRRKIKEAADGWCGAFSDTMILAVGYASLADHPDASVDDLEHMADADMYAEKDRYYRESGIDRRHR